MVYIKLMLRKYWFFFLFTFFVPVFTAANNAEEDREKKTFPPNAILVASYMGNVDLVAEILAAGVDKNHRSDSGGSALHMAVLQRNINVLKLLLEYGFDPNVKDTKDGYTPLHVAVAANNIEAARLLLQYKADKNIRNLAGQTPLDKARREEKLELVRLLIR